MDRQAEKQINSEADQQVPLQTDRDGCTFTWTAKVTTPKREHWFNQHIHKSQSVKQPQEHLFPKRFWVQKILSGQIKRRLRGNSRNHDKEGKVSWVGSLWRGNVQSHWLKSMWKHNKETDWEHTHTHTLERKGKKKGCRWNDGTPHPC